MKGPTYACNTLHHRCHAEKLRVIGEHGVLSRPHRCTLLKVRGRLPELSRRAGGCLPERRRRRAQRIDLIHWHGDSDWQQRGA